MRATTWWDTFKKATFWTPVPPKEGPMYVVLSETALKVLKAAEFAKENGMDEENVKDLIEAVYRRKEK